MGKGHHSCGVAVCRNTSDNARKRGLVIHFFRFPQDPRVKKEWIVKCCRADKTFNPNNARVCSSHFTLDDYEDSLKARIMGEIPIKLKKNAVPSLHLLPTKSIRQRSHPAKQLRRLDQNETIGQQLADENSNQDLSDLHAASTSSDLNERVKSLEEEVSNLSEKMKQNEESMQQRIDSLVKENKKLKEMLASKGNFKSPSCENLIIDGTESYDRELERRVSQFITSKVQIIVAELL